MFVLTYTGEDGEVYVLAVSSEVEALKDATVDNLHEMGFDDTGLSWSPSKGAPRVARAMVGADSYYEIVNAERV